jgi:hypothetical protein
MVADELDYVVGVDTHRNEHVLAVVVAPGGRGSPAPGAVLFFQLDTGENCQTASIPGHGAGERRVCFDPPPLGCNF